MWFIDVVYHKNYSDKKLFGYASNNSYDQIDWTPAVKSELVQITYNDIDYVALKIGNDASHYNYYFNIRLVVKP